jgi:signal transduction histidine kinase
VAVLTVISPALDAGLTVLAYAVGRYVGRWPARIVTAVLGFVVVTHLWTGGNAGDQVSQVIGFLVLLVLPGAIGALVRTRALLLQALRDRAERAESERELLARDAVLTERTRIAREMHDAVGHRVSLMVLQAGAIEVAAADRERVAQLAGQVQTAGRQALDELRQMVGVLRAEEADDTAPRAPQPGLADLPALVAQCRAAGMAVDLTVPPEGSAPVEAAAGRAAYRVVQEALTNAGKHAPGAAVRVAVDRPPGELALRVVNGPPSRPAGDVPGGGYGLVGLGERVRTLGGRLHAGPRLDGGFEIEAVLPA